MSTHPDYSIPGSYDEACAGAATRQGLDEPRDVLRLAGIPCRVDQTGGFTMVLVIPAESGHELWVTDDGDRDDDGWPIYLVGHYLPYDPECEYGECVQSWNVPLADLATFVRTWAKGLVAS